MGYYIDILSPGKDTNAALDNLGRSVGTLYAESWAANQQQNHEGKPFDLNVSTFSYLWLDGSLKIFIAYDDRTKTPLGFLVGVVYRPLEYKATVFQLRECFARGDAQLEKALLDHAVTAFKILGCDEVWIEARPGLSENLGPGWGPAKEIIMRKYIKE